MTDDRDFKKVVRKRSAKTGESYQAARRQLDRQAGLSAPVCAVWASPAGLILGCLVESGRITRDMSVTVMVGDDVLHHGTVASLRVAQDDKAVVSSGECGVILDPPFHGYRPVDEDDDDDEGRDHYPVEVVPLPYLLLG